MENPSCQIIPVEIYLAAVCSSSGGDNLESSKTQHLVCVQSTDDREPQFIHEFNLYLGPKTLCPGFSNAIRSNRYTSAEIVDKPFTRKAIIFPECGNCELAKRCRNHQLANSLINSEPCQQIEASEIAIIDSPMIEQGASEFQNP